MPSAELPIWAITPGLPSPYIARAALHAAAVLDQRGSRVSDARESYWHRATGGLFQETDLRRGERLLIDCGLVKEQEGVLVPTAELKELLDGTVEHALEVVTARTLIQTEPKWLTSTAPTEVPEVLQTLIPDPLQREELLLALGRRFDDTRQRLLGGIGEEIVAAEARRELELLGYLELARAVRRVSLESDQLGYDVSAPRVSGNRRLLEVKATAVEPSRTLNVHISRNEATVGSRFPNHWALVICRVTNLDTASGEIFGWCSRTSLDALLPQDTTAGHWEEALIEIPAEAFTPGLPRAVE